MADLGLIDSKLGLYIKINVNNGQNKFEVHISKNVAKMAILWPKIGQRHFGAHASYGHNLAIFHQILTNEHTKMTSSLRRIEWNTILSSISLFYILVFWPHFCSEASHGQCCTYGLKTTLKLLVHVLAIMASSYLKIVFQQKSGLNPPLNLMIRLKELIYLQHFNNCLIINLHILIIPLCACSDSRSYKTFAKHYMQQTNRFIVKSHFKTMFKTIHL